MDSGWIPLFVRETYTFFIPILIGISDSLSGIPYSKAQNTGFHSPIVRGFRIPKLSGAKTARIPEFG